MKIGIFHTTLPAPGRKLAGVEVFVHRLATALTESNIDAEVISLMDPPPGATYPHRRLFKHYPFLLKNQLCRLLLLPLLLNFCDFRKYDVVHFYGDDWFYFRRPVATVRSFMGAALFESRSAKSLKRKLKMRMVDRLEHLSAKLANVVLGLGTEAAAFFHADGVEKLFVQKSIFFPGEKTKSPTFVFIGNWEGRKRGRFVAEKFIDKVLPHCPDAKLLMACEFVPVNDAIVDLRHPTDEKLAQAVRQAWALLSASTYEGFGIPYLEAISSGTIVVTTWNSGAEFVLGAGHGGFIVSDQDYEKTILELIENAEFRIRQEALALARAQAFSEGRIVADLLAYYRLAISRFAGRNTKIG